MQPLDFVLKEIYFKHDSSQTTSTSQLHGLCQLILLCKPKRNSDWFLNSRSPYKKVIALSLSRQTIWHQIPTQQVVSRGGPRKFRKRGPSTTPSPPPLEWKLHLLWHAAYSIAGVFVMQSKVTLTFRKIVSKRILWNDSQIKIARHFENIGKRGGRGPLSLFPKSAYGCRTYMYA